MWPFAGGILNATPPETVSLQGTAGSPITRTMLALQPKSANVAFNVVCTASAPNNLIKGKVGSATYESGDLAVYSTIGNWVNPNDFQEGPYYIRATLESGVAPDSGTLGVWLTLANGGSNQFWRWEHDGPVVRTGTIKLEIATDAAGSNIVATGYYRANVSSES